MFEPDCSNKVFALFCKADIQFSKIINLNLYKDYNILRKRLQEKKRTQSEESHCVLYETKLLTLHNKVTHTQNESQSSLRHKVVPSQLDLSQLDPPGTPRPSQAHGDGEGPSNQKLRLTHGPYNVVNQLPLVALPVPFGL